ncbi:hemerythrin domain-containing protein [Sphingomonas sp. ASV193]|uniref:hemerythrin domain-containing protein n=1 Tax=Sphingomonas sp. ASV193 TaxID=3144405 RepID=UPI0032E91903
MAAKDIFERLKVDHDRQRNWIERIENTSGDTPERRELFETFRIDIKAHASSEEVVLYSQLMSEVDMREYARHAAADHHEIDDAAKKVADTPYDSPAWLANFKALKKTYLDHLKEEEETIFPDALKDIGEERAVEMRDAFNELKPEEVERQEAGKDDKIAEHIG